MNQFLSELYGTCETIGATGDSSDVEKLAEAQILDGILQSEGIDVDQLDDGTILKLAHEIFGDGSELVKAAAEGEGDAPKECKDCGKTDCECPKAKEAQPVTEQSGEEKTAEADLLGRIMAHSMVQELGQIEAEKTAGAGQALKNWGQLARYGASQAKGAVGGAAKAAKGKPGAMKKTYQEAGGGLKGALETAKQHKKTVGGAAALGTAGAAGGTYAAMRKKGSALDTLAEQRALEILAENGIDPQAAETTETKLASAVEQRAWEMLAEAGYTQAEE
jgi:hypothetical protein